MDERLSVDLIQALSQVWSAIRARHPDVPGVVILAAPAPRDQPRVMGHFAALRWSVTRQSEHLVHEVVVVAEYLNRPAEETLDTLLHEAAHALNFARGKKDCTRSQYHNLTFKKAAEELGLSVTQVPNYGFADTKLPLETAERYRAELDALGAVLIHRRRLVMMAAGPVPGGSPTTNEGEGSTSKGSSSRARKATCQCPFIIRVSKKVLESTTIRCESCGQPFSLT